MLAVMEKEGLTNKELVDKFNNTFSVGNKIWYRTCQHNINDKIKAERRTSVKKEAFSIKDNGCYFISETGIWVDVKSINWKNSKEENRVKRT